MTNTEFVRTWLESKSAKEVAKKLQVSVQSVRARYKFLKEKGVHLKPHERETLTEEGIEALNAIINGKKA